MEPSHYLGNAYLLTFVLKKAYSYFNKNKEAILKKYKKMPTLLDKQYGLDGNRTRDLLRDRQAC